MSVKPSENQIPLDFYPSKARARDPKTSHDAARNVKDGTIRALILNTLSQGDLATFQIAIILDKDRDAISPHMKPLERMGMVRRLDQTVKNPKTGNECEIWQKVIEYSSDK